MLLDWRREAVSRRLAFALLLGAAALASGCATAQLEDPVELELQVNADKYQIGEPVTATVTVRNKASTGVVVPALDNSTLGFYLGQSGTGLRMKRRPVLPQGLPPEQRVVAPGAAVSRSFLFTELTFEPGDWGVMASLSGHRAAGGALLPECYSKPAYFAVEDSVMFQRDPFSGIIVADQAIALARAQAQAPPETRARAVLAKMGGSGLYFWTVLIGGDAEGGGGAEAYQVNAYTGRVQPLDLKELEGPARKEGTQ
jgi:membrane-bound inhibitor of C-type lysozyme